MHREIEAPDRATIMKGRIVTMISKVRLNGRMLTVILFAFLVLVLNLRNASAQTKSPVIRSASGHYYQVIHLPQGSNQAQAAQYAQSQRYGNLHGELIQIHTYTEYADMAARFNHAGISLNNLWTGGTSFVFYDARLLPEYVFYWFDGTLVTYNDWFPGQPDRHYYVENAIVTWSPDGRWNNISATARTGNNGQPLGLLVEYH